MGSHPGGGCKYCFLPSHYFPTDEAKYDWKIKGEDGQWMEDERRVSKLVVDHFKSLFTSEGCRDWGEMLDCIILLVTEAMHA